MSTPTPTHPPAEAPASGGSKTLWAAMLVLVVVVLAMGAALIRVQSRPIEPRMVVLPTPDQPTATPVSAENNVQNTAVAPINKASAAIDSAASDSTVETSAKPRPVLPRTPEPAVLRPPALDTSDSGIAKPAAQ